MWTPTRGKGSSARPRSPAMSGLAASRPARSTARISPGAITAQIPSRSTATRRDDYFYQYGPLYGDMRCTNPANPNDPARVLWKEWGLHQSELPSPAISATRSWACPMAARFSSSATRARRYPRRRRRRLPFSVLRQSGSIQSSGGNRSRPNSPARAPRRLRGRHGSPVGFFLKLIHSHFGNGGGWRRGNGGGGIPARPIPRFGFDGILRRWGRRRRSGGEAHVT